jgi:hypothetical protein
MFTLNGAKAKDPQPPSRPALRRLVMRPSRDKLAEAPQCDVKHEEAEAIVSMPLIMPTFPSPTAEDIQARSPSYAVWERDVLYSTINEYQLPGYRLSAYANLVDLLDLNLYPLFAEGQTWYLCRGKGEDLTSCKRMVPEDYFRTTLGILLKLADNVEYQGDDLVEKLATALSYAICSKHHPIHKILRAHEASQVILQWRERYSNCTRSTGG